MATESPYLAARQVAALLDLTDRGRLLLTGADSAAYLQGLLTNDIEALSPGQGCYAVYLTPQGRMIADMSVLRIEDGILLDVDASVTDALRERLEEFIFAEDVEVEDRSDSWTSLVCCGPEAAAMLAGLLDGEGGGDAGRLEGLAEYAHLSAKVDSAEVVVASTRTFGVPGFLLYLETDAGGTLSERLVEKGAVRLSADAAELLRIEAGRPVFPADLGPDVIPLEAGIEDRAISMTKGCYVGQEVIVRILHRGGGRVVRRLVGLRFEDEVEAGDVLVADQGEQDPDEAGTVTSVATAAGGGERIGLGYVKRDLAEVGTRLRTATGHGGTVVALPFRPASDSPAS